MSQPNDTPVAPDPPTETVTYRNPRRTSPDNSITLRHHRLGRQASRRPPVPPHIPAVKVTSHPASPRRHSSGESNDTGVSDPRKWFDGANSNAQGDLDTSAMDVDPPFYQKETDSSNEENGQGRMIPSQSPAYRFVQHRGSTLRPGVAHSSSAGDYRSVIDDLTIENKRLREELKRYRQMGPDSLRREKLFEVKVHGLPSQKKRELEAALRDFTQSLDGSSTGTPNRNKKNSAKSKNMYSGMSKHASSSSGSNSRPVDSAYASMGTGPSSSVPSVPAKGANSKRANQKIENYLRDIPEGLWPRATFLNEKEKKKLVVRRLEHLFTGKMASQAGAVQKEGTQPTKGPAPIVEDVEMGASTSTLDDKEQKIPSANEPSREAQIRPHKLRGKESHSRDDGSASNSRSREDQTESRDNGNASGSGSGSGHAGNTSSPQDEPPAEQRPTRPRDLDPDRKQVPSENMDYIRHLGIKAPEAKQDFSSQDVSPDAEGWVYLNLLCNLAQLHILNVTPDFIRSAVSEKSTKFQLSPDGRKIRWRGGVEGTKFSSDLSGSNSQKSQSSDDTDGSNGSGQRKKQRSDPNDVMQHKGSNFKPQVSDTNSTESFHYKPLFVHQQASSSDDPPSLGEETGSSYGPPEDSNVGGNARWGQSGVSTGQSQRKRRRDGAIIYYSGAPFCTDLSGDYGEVSTDAYMASSGDQEQSREHVMFDLNRPLISRSSSGSSLPFRPLSERALNPTTSMDVDGGPEAPDLTSGETDSDDSFEANFEWSDKKQYAPLINLEASGLYGIYPDDHFAVIVSTQRSKCPAEDSSRPEIATRPSNETHNSRGTADSITGRLANMTTGSPVPLYVSNTATHRIELVYLGAKVRRLPPVPLPPPSFYFPNADETDMDMETDSTSGLLSRRVTDGAYADDDDLSGNDEEDEHSEGEGNLDSSASISPGNDSVLPTVTELGIPIGRRHPGRMRGMSKVTGSSAATAGGAGSGYQSSMGDA